MKLSTLPLLLGTLFLPSPVCAALEHMFLYFPDSEMVMTPATMRLSYEDVFFTAEDGTKLHGWYLPGNPNSQWWCSAMATLGISLTGSTTCGY